MEGTFLFIFYLLLFIFEIILFVFALKKGKAFWKVLFLVEVISLIIPNILLNIYEHLLPDDSIFPGLSYLAESLYSFGAIILYSLIFFISISTKIIIYEKKQKILGKKYVNPIVSIIGVIFLFIGSFYLIQEMQDNFGRKKITGTVIDIETQAGIDWNIVSFSIDGKAYEDNFVNDNEKIGDKVTIYYRKGYEPVQYLTDNKIIYIPAFALGILILVIRYRDKIIFKSYNSKINN